MLNKHRELEIRKVSERERIVVLKLAEQIFDFFDYYWFKKWLLRSTILLAELSRKPVGIAELVVRKSICGTTGVIMYLGVIPEARGKGIGKALVKESEKFFMNRGIRVFMASTRSWNKTSITLFKKLGYRVLELSYLYKHLNYELVYRLIASLHAYEDDIIFVKSLDRNCILEHI